MIAPEQRADDAERRRPAEVRRRPLHSLFSRGRGRNGRRRLRGLQRSLRYQLRRSADLGAKWRFRRCGRRRLCGGLRKLLGVERPEYVNAATVVAHGALFSVPVAVPTAFVFPLSSFPAFGYLPPIQFAVYVASGWKKKAPSAAPNRAPRAALRRKCDFCGSGDVSAPTI